MFNAMRERRDLFLLEEIGHAVDWVWRKRDASQLQRLEELSHGVIELLKRNSFIRAHDVRSQNSAFAFLVLTDVEDQRNGIGGIVDAVQFINATSQEANVIREKALALTCVDEHGIGLAIDVPDTLDARFEPEAQNF